MAKVEIDVRALKTLIDAAHNYADDWASGLADGTYEETKGLEDIEWAIDEAEQAIDFGL